MSTRTFRDKIAEMFKRHPNVWIDGMELAHVGGCYASRTRISECRTQLGMTITNRVRTLPNGCKVSEYRYQPPSPPAQVGHFEVSA